MVSWSGGPDLPRALETFLPECEGEEPLPLGLSWGWSFGHLLSCTSRWQWQGPQVSPSPGCAASCRPGEASPELCGLGTGTQSVGRAEHEARTAGDETADASPPVARCTMRVLAVE